MQSVIQVKNLYKLYYLGEETVRALDGVDFEIKKGEFCAIVGTSGSGKSTLLNMLAGLEKPTKGEVVISGHHLERMNEEQLVSFRRRRVGFIFQAYQLIASMDAEENVALPLNFRGVKRSERTAKARLMLERVKLGKYRKHFPNQMSGGKVVRRFLHVGVSVYFIKYKYHRFATAANLCQCLVHYLNLFLKSGVGNIDYVHKQICFTHFIQGRFKRFYQVGRQLANKSYRIRQQER